MYRLERIFLGILAALLAYAAYVQLNDPDPWIWIGVYLSAALICAAAAAFRKTFGLSYIASIGALAAAALLGWELATAETWRPMYPEQVDGTVGLLETEKGREMIGLVIISAACGLAAWVEGGTLPADDDVPEE